MKQCITYRSKAIGLLVIGFCLIPLLVKYYFYPDYPGSDDSFIHLKIIKNYTHNFTWGINKGQNVNLSTSPLFTIVMITINFFTNNLLQTGMFLSAVASVFSVYGVYLIARHFTKYDSTALLITFLFSINVFLWRWTGTFIETTYSVGFGIWILYYFVSTESKSSKHYLLLGFFIGLATLTRPELFLLSISCFVHSFVNNRKNILQNYTFVGIGFTIVFINYLLFSLTQFSTLIPSTFYAKTSQQINIINKDLIKNLIAIIMLGSPGTILSICYFSFLRSNPKKDLFIQSIVLWVFPILFIAFYYLNVPYMQSPARYFLPIIYSIPMLLILFEPKDFSKKVKVISSSIAIASLLFSLLFNSIVIQPVLERVWSEYIYAMKGAAEVVNEGKKNGTTVYVTSDIGVVSYTLDPEIVITDGGKLASPEYLNVKTLDIIKETKPDYIIDSYAKNNSLFTLLKKDNIKATLIWNKNYQSHGIKHPNRVYNVKTYKIEYE